MTNEGMNLQEGGKKKSVEKRKDEISNPPNFFNPEEIFYVPASTKPV